MKIVIDPGHGGKDPGAVGNGLQEKNVALDISLRVAKLLRMNGQQVILTREKDETLPLDARRTPACDISVSIHINAGGGTGLETFVSVFNRPAESRKLGQAIQENVLKQMPFRDRGLKTKINSKGNTDYLYMLRAAKGVPVLVEVGFIDNTSDANILKDKANLDKIAKGIAAGIMQYMGKELKDVEETKIKYQGKQYEGLIIDGRTYVELRKLCEAIGLKVHYDSKTKEVEVKL